MKQIEGWTQIMNQLCFLKELYDMGREDVMDVFCFITCDNYYENCLEAIDRLYVFLDARYYERNYTDVRIYSSGAMMNFYSLAGEYGQLLGIPDAENSYLIDAAANTNKYLGGSYYCDYILCGHTQPQWIYHSRIAILTDASGNHDPGFELYGLMQLMQFHETKIKELEEKIALIKSGAGKEVSV